MRKNWVFVSAGVLLFILFFQNFTITKKEISSIQNTRLQKMQTASGFYSEERIILPLDIRAGPSIDQKNCTDFSTAALEVEIKHELRVGDEIQIALKLEGRGSVIETYVGEAGGVSPACGNKVNSVAADVVMLCLDRTKVGFSYINLVYKDFTGVTNKGHVPLEGSCPAMPQRIVIE